MRFKTFYCQNDKLYIQDVRVAKNGIKMRSGAFYDIRYSRGDEVRGQGGRCERNVEQRNECEEGGVGIGVVV